MKDSLLFSLMQEGDRKAFKILFNKYYSPLSEYASQFIVDQEAEELVQDLMLFVWENKEDIVIDSSVKSYLFTATRHRCLNAIKKAAYHQRVHSIIYEKLKDQFEDPDYYLANELAEKIDNAIKELPETYRETFIISRFGDKTNTQVAEQLGVSVKTVEYRISQSLKILRIKLKDYLPLVMLFLS